MQDSMSHHPSRASANDTVITPMFGPLCALALVAGTSFSLLLPHLLGFTFYVAVAVTGALAWIWRWRARGGGALLFGFAWAGIHASLSLSGQLPPALEMQEVVLTGHVSGLPEHEARRTRFDFVVESGAEDADVLRGSTVRLAWYDDYAASQPGPRLRLHAGQRWRVVARVRAPRGLRNPAGFDSERNAMVQRLAATGYLRHPELTASRLGPSSGIDAWREMMSARIGWSIDAESSRFIRALALGDTRALRDEDWSVLRAAGLTHLIAISGFHVGIVAASLAVLVGGIWRIFPMLGRHVPRPQIMALATVCAALGYAALAGFALPTVRTVLMMGVWALARIGRRRASVMQALALALLAVLLVDPLSSLAAGFWLSFAGVAWLAWCLPDTGQTHWLRGFVSAQAVATIGLLPLTVMLFDQASAAGPFVNLIAIPWWSLVVIPLSLLGLAMEACMQGTGTPLWHAAAWCFDLTWPTFTWAANSHFALWWIAESPGWSIALAAFAAFWMLMPRGTPGKSLALLLWCPLLIPDTHMPSAGEVELTMIDVGQGLSILVRTRDHSLLYDMGPAVRDGFDAGERAVIPTLRGLGVRRLDRMVISHGDNDHIGGFASVQAALPARQVIVPAGMPQATAAMQHCLSGQFWEWDGVRFSFLHPGVHFPYLGNQASCVLRIETSQGTALLAGDIGEVVERMLVRDQPAAMKSSVVIAAHHGSGGSSDAAFVAATHPRLVLVSRGYGNRFGHPKPWIVQRWQASGAEVLDTANSGAIQVWLGNDGLQVRERRHARPRLWDAVERLAREQGREATTSAEEGRAGAARGESGG